MPGLHVGNWDLGIPGPLPFQGPKNYSLFQNPIPDEIVLNVNEGELTGICMPFFLQFDRKSGRLPYRVELFLVSVLNNKGELIAIYSAFINFTECFFANIFCTIVRG